MSYYTRQQAQHPSAALPVDAGTPPGPSKAGTQPPAPTHQDAAATNHGAGDLTTTNPIDDIAKEIANDISNISEEGKVIVSSILKLVKAIQISSAEKDTKIMQLESKVDKLQTRIVQLETSIDDCNQ